MTPLEGACLIEPEQLVDERGFFARSYCREEFARAGLVADFVQSNISFNTHKGTLRGLHFQALPFPETKLIRCTMGSVFDVIVDIRAGSPTQGKWFGVELSAANRLSMYVPDGFAHGFVTLCDDCELCYQMSELYHAECARTVAWNDIDIGIDWPQQPIRIAARDAAAPGLRDVLSVRTET